MKVRMLTAISGVPTAAAGEIVDVDNAYAKRLLNGGLAEPVAKKPVQRSEKRPAGKRRETR